MQVITEPTIIPGDECEELRAEINNDSRFKELVPSILQMAFDEGRKLAPEVTPAPIEVSTKTGGKPPMPAIRSYAEIEEDEPRNPVEVLILNASPPRGTPEENAFRNMLGPALRYVAGKYDQ